MFVEARPGTNQQRAGTASGKRTAATAGRGNSARNIRLGSASMFALGDPTAPLFHTSRLNPLQFASKPGVSKILFLYLYYHEGDVKKALDLCDAVLEVNKGDASWWWNTQKGRCLIALGNAREAEQYLKISINLFPGHPDTVLLTARAYCRIDQPIAALDICAEALKRLPNDISLLKQQVFIYFILLFFIY